MSELWFGEMSPVWVIGMLHRDPDAPSAILARLRCDDFGHIFSPGSVEAVKDSGQVVLLQLCRRCAYFCYDLAAEQFDGYLVPLDVADRKERQHARSNRLVDYL